MRYYKIAKYFPAIPGEKFTVPEPLVIRIHFYLSYNYTLSTLHYPLIHSTTILTDTTQYENVQVYLFTERFQGESACGIVFEIES